jgi:hypothetical protein
MDAAVKEHQCANCGTVGCDTFCAHCGQKHPRPGDLSFANAWRHVVDEVLNFDGRIFDTIKLLFTRPGQLTLDYLEGRRARHVHPLRLFLIFSALYFFIEGPGYSEMIAFNAVRNLPAAEPAGLAFIAGIDALAEVVYKAAFIAALPLNGFILWLLFRKYHTYVAEHTIAALHLSCVLMTLLLLVGRLGRWLNLESLMAGVVALPYLLYSQLALRKVYAGSPIKASVTACALYVFNNLVPILVTFGAASLAVALSGSTPS